MTAFPAEEPLKNPAAAADTKRSQNPPTQMSSWTIGKRIVFISATLIALTLGTAVSVFVSLSNVDTDVKTMSTDVIPGLIWAGASKANAAENFNNVVLAGSAQTKEEAAAYIARVREVSAKHVEILKEYEKSINEPEDRRNFETLNANRKAYSEQREIYLALLADGKRDEAAGVLKGKLLPAFQVYFQSNDMLVEYNRTSGKQLVESSAGNLKATTRVVVIAAGLSLVLGVIFSVVVIRGLSRALRGITGQLSGGAEQTASAAGLLSSASQSLAEGASEQAASLEETSASLEEIASMTKRNAESATHAKQLSDETRQAAEGGAANMSEMKQAMDGIKTASGNIAKIVRTIDEIAFQTNILALNAAVEAARAGEAGAGFAVVAEEVRSLAQRSANSAKETAEKIEDSVARSEHGVQISAKVAQSLDEILLKARKVDGLVAEIATASNEQSQGIGQVTVAVSQMDKVTQGNAASAEESASASEELSAQAEMMRESVRSLQALVGGRTAAASAIVVPEKPAKRTLSPKLTPVARGLQPALTSRVAASDANGSGHANGTSRLNGGADHDQFFK
jgi:methyl-accepting chemotaxis protein